jgi:glycosyltransferase involved in cell wall biosynthesis
MRIVQVIDSLDIGGAEKMAINYANALAEKIEFSGIVATRKEGNLKNQINANVSYLFLNRKKTIDLNAILKFRRYCKDNQITHLQPHSSSYFMAILIKLIYFKLIIIWHDHNGLSEFLSSKKSFFLKIISYSFKGIITVNYQLKNWAIKELNCKNVIYLPNFTTIDFSSKKTTQLKGIDGKRILCLANLRRQKNHFFLLNIAEKVSMIYPDWTFHLVGKDFEDEYSMSLKKSIYSKNLQDHVYIYGSKDDTTNIINQSEICVFTSSSEGLPVALLEFGLLSKAVVSTSVGEIPLIIENEKNGFIVPVNDEKSFVTSLSKLIKNNELRTSIGLKLNETIEKNHSNNAIIKQYLNWLEKI